MQEGAHWFRQSGSHDFYFSWNVDIEISLFLTEGLCELALDKSTLNVSLNVLDDMDRIKGPS